MQPSTGFGRSLASRFPLIVFYVLALSFSGLIVGILVVLGVAENLFFLATFGPGLAAVVTVGISDDRSTAWRFVKRSMQWRFSLVWWAVTILLPLAVTAVALMVAGSTGGPALDSELWASLLTTIPLIVMLTVLNGIPEEIGWRGFMLPLAQRGRSSLLASLVVGFWSGVWHVPVFFIDGTFQSTLRDELGFGMSLGFWTAASMVFAIGYTWLFNSVGGSAVAAGVLHGATNAWIGWGLSERSSSESVELFAWFSAGWLVVAVFLLVVNGAGTLTRSERKIISYVE